LAKHAYLAEENFRQEVLLKHKETVQALHDRKLNNGTITAEYKRHLQYVIERQTKFLMLSKNYAAAQGCHA
jgi:hypothetical protein